MIDRTIYKEILQAIKEKPIVFVLGARGIGKTTLCELIEKDLGFGYVSLSNPLARLEATIDPAEFLCLHQAPLIIDEIQKAPILFDYLEGAVDEAKRQGKKESLYVLTGSETYKLMKGVTESMCGRVAFIHMSPLSLSEVKGVEELPFEADPIKAMARAKDNAFTSPELYATIVRGLYPELYDKPYLKTASFYADYLESYLAKDVSDILQVNNRGKFLNLMCLLASLTGQELIYSNLAKGIGIDVKTVQGWVSVLEAGNIIHLLQPYSEMSIAKQLVHRPKVYFSDTGLACFLAKVNGPEMLEASYLKGRMVETFIVNEIMKSYRNARKEGEAGFYYYRDAQGNEVDLVILKDGQLSLLECKSGEKHDLSEVSGFRQLEKSRYPIKHKAIICPCREAMPLGKGVYALPISAI
ncbi:MAG: DUF4143 domain-containing protein [Bacilli bacterium]|nr:DUF4143 domain-containing protein [Bacilli bacterium]